MLIHFGDWRLGSGFRMGLLSLLICGCLCFTLLSLRSLTFLSAVEFRRGTLLSSRLGYGRGQSFFTSSSGRSFISPTTYTFRMNHLLLVSFLPVSLLMPSHSALLWYLSNEIRLYALTRGAFRLARIVSSWEFPYRILPDVRSLGSTKSWRDLQSWRQKESIPRDII